MSSNIVKDAPDTHNPLLDDPMTDIGVLIRMPKDDWLRLVALLGSFCSPGAESLNSKILAEIEVDAPDLFRYVMRGR